MEMISNMDWRRKKRDNGLLGKRFGPNNYTPTPGEIPDIEKLRKSLESDAKFVYQDLIDGWRQARDGHDYQVGSHITPINCEGEES